MADCFLTTAKYMLLVLNFAFALGGLSFIIHGGIIQSTLNFYDVFFVKDFSLVAVVFIVLGMFLFVAAGCACCSVIRETRTLLVLYGVSLLAIVALQVAGGVLLHSPAWRTDVGTRLHDSMTRSQLEYVSGDDTEMEAAQHAWDFVQRDFECCGVDSYKEWYLLKVRPLPISCLCKDIDSDNCSAKARVYNVGCHQKLALVIIISEEAMSTIAFAMAAIELPGAACALILARAAGQQNPFGYRMD